MTRTYRARIPFLGAIALAAAIGFGAAGCEIEQTEEGRMPDVDVDAKGGNMPEYDVDTPDVDVDAKGGRLPDYDIEKKQDGALPDVDIDVKDPDEADADTNATE